LEKHGGTFQGFGRLAESNGACERGDPLHTEFPEARDVWSRITTPSAAVSIPSNISEGQQRYSSPDFRHFLRITRGPLAELETQLILAKELGYITPAQLDAFTEQIATVGKLIAGLIRSLSARAASA
jgi:four helix bundle protein